MLCNISSRCCLKRCVRRLKLSLLSSPCSICSMTLFILLTMVFSSVGTWLSKPVMEIIQPELVATTLYPMPAIVASYAKEFRSARTTRKNSRQLTVAAGDSYLGRCVGWVGLAGGGG